MSLVYALKSIQTVAISWHFGLKKTKTIDTLDKPH